MGVARPYASTGGPCTAGVALRGRRDSGRGPCPEDTHLAMSRLKSSNEGQPCSAHPRPPGS
eukprot:10792375-Alexandrium_andersonii.AAC.1